MTPVHLREQACETMVRLLLTLGILWGLSGISLGVEPTRPNIILFLIDDPSVKPAKTKKKSE